MSIAVLTQVYDEARRLAVAGSVVARGDFRLKKLLPLLEQAGAKAPIFAKVAESAKAVIEGPEATSAANLLELTSLVTAVLYTQGETWIEGTIEPIESTDLGGTMAQTSARLLKPLLEALTSTGSGRLELVKDAHQRGAFRDLRLVKPALNGLDDPYSEIGDFLAEKVLPMYGKAILPELRSKYDPKGTKGHPRRLELMHALDPVETRELVKQALDGGSKEVKVSAIACLGAAPEDLAYLIEQASAKAQDVRSAAYKALAGIDDPAAVAVLEKALNGKDLFHAANAIQHSGNNSLSTMLISEVSKAAAELPKTKEKKEVSAQAGRLVHLIRAMPRNDHAAADRLTLNLFSQRAALDKVKGADYSGSDVVEAVIQRMMFGSKLLQSTLAKAHADLEASELPSAFHAARLSLPAAEVYDQFAPYLLANDKKAKNATAKQKAISQSLGSGYSYWHWLHDDDDDDEAVESRVPPLDPRWLDVALKLEDVGLVNTCGRPGHAKMEAFLDSAYAAAVKKGKGQDPVHPVLIAMVRHKHPRAAECLIASYEKTIGKPQYGNYWYIHLIPDLPKSAIPALEAVTPKLKDREADQWLEAIQELREKP